MYLEEITMYQPTRQSSSSDHIKSEKKRKREFVTADFTPEQEQEMVDWLQAPEQQCLLNKKHPNYTKKGFKDSLWEKKAWDMEKTSNDLKKWYANMRSRYGKLNANNVDPDSPELTARDRWIVLKFQFLKPHLIVHTKKRLPGRSKASASVDGEREGESESESEYEHVSEHQLHVAGLSEADTSFGSQARAIEGTEEKNLDLQNQLLGNIFQPEKSPLQRQKDMFADFMKEVTYTFPLPVWLRFQSDVNGLLQKYQLELHQATKQERNMDCQGSYS